METPWKDGCTHKCKVLWQLWCQGTHQRPPGVPASAPSQVPWPALSTLPPRVCRLTVQAPLAGWASLLQNWLSFLPSITVPGIHLRLSHLHASAQVVTSAWVALPPALWSKLSHPSSWYLLQEDVSCRAQSHLPGSHLYVSLYWPMSSLRTGILSYHLCSLCSPSTDPGT